MDMIEDIYELSPAQQGMFFHSLSAQTPEAQFQRLSCAIQGTLDVPAFALAWQRLVERHPVLRSAFFLEDLDRPVQVVQRQASVVLEQHDWRTLPIDARHEHLRAFLKADLERGFALDRSPLMRLTLIRYAADVYEFIWSRHHILLDGWSVGLLLREVFALYAALRQGDDLQLTPTRPYRDYIAWLQQQNLAEAE